MDPATPIGMVMALALMATTLGEHSLLNSGRPGTALFFVIWATLAALLMHFSPREMRRGIKSFPALWVQPRLKIRDMPALFAGYAARARTDGLLCLEAESETMGDARLKLGIQLAADGLDERSIRRILDSEARGLAHRLATGTRCLRYAGIYALFAGMAGCLLSLLKGAETMTISSYPLAWASALALLFLPLSGKLGQRMSEQAMIGDLLADGISGLASGENPRMLERRLLVTLAPTDRESLFGP